MQRPVVHTATDRAGAHLYHETLTAVCPVQSGPGQLIDHFMLSAAQSLAVLRGGGMGDLLMLTPVLQRVHSEYPHLDITLFCDPQFIPLMGALDWLHVLPRNAYAGREFSYDARVDLHLYVERSILRTSVDRTSLFGAAFGLSIKQGLPLYRVSATEAEWAASWFEQQGILEGPVVALAPWATDPRRTWPLDHAQDLCARIGAAGGTTLVLHHAPAIAEHFVEDERTRVVAGLELRQVAAIMQKCRGVVSVDTGIYHLASAVQRQGSPYITLVWGMWAPQLRTKWMKNYTAVHAGPEVGCYPCNEMPASSTCSFRCMNISAERVWQEGLSFLFGDKKT